MENTNVDISIIVPLYNEEQIFYRLIERINKVIKNAKFSCNIILVNDGSADSTGTLIKELCHKDSRYIGVFLSRNFGHQLAVSAGLSIADGKKGIMIIDGDLQDPPELIHDFYDLLNDGNDVIYAVRTNRKENFLKRFSYFIYYRIQKKISNFNIPIDSGDFSMISRRVVDAINQMPEQSRYIRGMRAWVGFKQIAYKYNRDERIAGTTKYSWRKLIELALNGVFNFSDFPIKFITRLGFLTVLISLFYFIYNLYRKFFYNDVPKGFTATLLTIVLFSGVQLISLGVIGEYILRIYNEVRKRPLYIIDKIIRK